MTRETKNTLESELTSLQNLNIRGKLFASYPRSAIGDIVISRFTGESFVYYIERVVENFSQQLLGSDWQFWNQNCMLPQGQYIDITAAIANLRTNISNNQFQNAESFLWAIVNFQIVNSFWNEKNISTVKRTKIAEMLSNLESRKQEYDNHIRDLLLKITESFTKLDDKANKLAEIESARNSLSAILQDAKNEFGKYVTVDSDIQSKKEEIASNIRELKEELTKAKEYKNDIKSDLGDINDIKERIKGEYDYIKRKSDEVTDLSGRTSDNALAFSFRNRKKELELRVNFWKWFGIPMTFILSGGWIYISYNFIEIQIDSDILKLLFFTGKLSLSILLLVFSFREYMKERKLLEDYSFKTAVAFTVNSYADQIAMHRNIEESDPEYYDLIKAKEKARQEFIENTVKDLYSKPFYRVDSSIKNISINPSELIKLKDDESLMKTSIPNIK